LHSYIPLKGFPFLAQSLVAKCTDVLHIDSRAMLHSIALKQEFLENYKIPVFVGFQSLTQNKHSSDGFLSIECRLVLCTYR